MYDNGHYLTKNRLISRYQLAKLHTFEAVARHKSFSQAADELSISPSAVSHQINKLEDELHFKLFNRFHRRIELTQDGENLFNVIKKSLTILNQEILEIKNQELAGTLTIYSRPSFAQGWLVPKLSEFSQKHPYMTLNILTGNEIINFNRHRIDLAIYYDDLHYEDLNVYHLMNETISPVCSPYYADKFNLYNNIDQLKQCTLLHDNQAWGYDSNFDEWQTWQDNFNVTLDIMNFSMMLFDRSDLAVTAAINHAGIAMGRKHIIEKFIESKELIMPFNNMTSLCKQRYYIVTPSNRQNFKANVFIKWISDTMK